MFRPRACGPYSEASVVHLKLKTRRVSTFINRLSGCSRPLTTVKNISAAAAQTNIHAMVGGPCKGAVRAGEWSCNRVEGAAIIATTGKFKNNRGAWATTPIDS